VVVDKEDNITLHLFQVAPTFRNLLVARDRQCINALPYSARTLSAQTQPTHSNHSMRDLSQQRPDLQGMSRPRPLQTWSFIIVHIISYHIISKYIIRSARGEPTLSAADLVLRLLHGPGRVGHRPAHGLGGQHHPRQEPRRHRLRLRRPPRGDRRTFVRPSKGSSRYFQTNTCLAYMSVY
jgi:hypothetical protein